MWEGSFLTSTLCPFFEPEAMPSPEAKAVLQVEIWRMSWAPSISPGPCLLSKDYAWIKGFEGAGPEGRKRHSWGRLILLNKAPEELGK